MPRFRLLALDIDGTLVNSRLELSEPTVEAVHRAQKAGIRVVLATGRRYSRVLPLVEPLGVKVPLVTSTGALIKDPRDHRTLYRAQFPPQVLRQVVQEVWNQGFDPVLCCDTFLQGFDYYCPRDRGVNEQLAEFFSKNPGCHRLLPGLLQEPPLEAFCGFTMGTREQMLDLKKWLEHRLPGQLELHVLRSPRYEGFICEIMPQGVSKWSGILRLAAQWGIGPQHICAVGDDVNDVPMLRQAGLGVAMGNAPPEVKQAATRVAPCHDSHGVAEVVRWLLEDDLPTK